MDFNIIHRGEVTKAAKLVFDHTDLFSNQVKGMAGKRFELVISEETNEISADTMGFYWGGILKTAYSTNAYSWMDNSEQIHYQVFAPKFLSYEKAVDLGNGKVKMKRMIRSLSDLNQKEMNAFIERVIIDLAEEGIEVAEPSQYKISKRYRTTKK